MGKASIAVAWKISTLGAIGGSYLEKDIGLQWCRYMQNLHQTVCCSQNRTNCNQDRELKRGKTKSVRMKQQQREIGQILDHSWSNIRNSAQSNTVAGLSKNGTKSDETNTIKTWNEDQSGVI